MSELSIVAMDGHWVADSREVAGMTEKRHDHLLRDIDGWVKILESSTAPNLGASEFFRRGSYTDAKGEVRRMYYLTRKGCDMVANKMTGEKGVLFTAAYVTKFEEMERNQQQSPQPYKLPQTFQDALRMLADEVEENEQLKKKQEEDRPKVMFAEAVEVSKSDILVRDLAKILRQNGIDIGEKRLFAFLRDDGYLIRKKGTDWNMPTQRSMDMGLFRIKPTAIHHSNGTVTVGRTPKVTGKGQIYFVNRFKKQKGVDTIALH